MLAISLHVGYNHRMAILRGQGTLKAEVVMVLTEAEAGALDALVGYGFEPFKKVFFKELGEAYMKPYEAGLKSLFESIRTGDASVSGILDRARDARKVFSGAAVARDRESA